MGFNLNAGLIVDLAEARVTVRQQIVASVSDGDLNHPAALGELRAGIDIDGVELTRFRGRLILWEKGVHDAEVETAVPA